MRWVEQCCNSPLINIFTSFCALPSFPGITQGAADQAPSLCVRAPFCGLDFSIYWGSLSGARSDSDLWMPMEGDVMDKLDDMASVSEFDPITGNIPATKVEITVSCR